MIDGDQNLTVFQWPEFALVIGRGIFVMEKFFYEYRPFIFALVAVVMFFNHTYSSKLLTGSSGLLLGMSLLILHSRWKHRSFIKRLNL